MFDYRPKYRVTAAQWREDNLDEMKELLKDVVDCNPDGDPQVYADFVEPYYFASSKIGSKGYWMLKTEFDEFDPGMWVVVYEDNSLEQMSDQEFKKMFEKV